MTRVCVQQLDPVVGDLDGNRRLALSAIAEAVEAGAEVIVLPELVTSGYMFESAQRPRRPRSCPITRSSASGPTSPAATT